MSKRTVASIKDMKYTISIMRQLLGIGLSGHNVITGYSQFNKAVLHDGAKDWVRYLDEKYHDPTP